MPVKAIILDLDDTLFMTQVVACEMERAAAISLGLTPVDPLIHRQTWGLGIEEALPLRLPGVNSGYYPAFITAHANQIKDAASSGRLDQITTSNIAALARLQEAGYALYVLTSRHSGEAAHLLDNTHPLNQYVSAEAMYYRERLSHHKPDPRVFNIVLQENHLRAADCVYVGDSVTDCQAATGANVSFICCLESGLRTRHEFENLPQRPIGYINTFADLPQLMDQLSS